MACPQNDSWEEKWGEHYTANGAANKYADKWGKDGPNVWHERWGEDYDGGGGCVKYTDKVMARPLPSACTMLCCCISSIIRHVLAISSIKVSRTHEVAAERIARTINIDCCRKQLSFLGTCCHCTNVNSS